MTKHFLYHTQVGTIGKQMTGKTVAQRVRMDIFADTRQPRGILYHCPYPFTVELSAAV
jgi:hypothetical protein